MQNMNTSGKQHLFINIAPLRNLRIVCPKYAYHGYDDASVDENCFLTFWWYNLISNASYIRRKLSVERFVQACLRVWCVIDYIDE